MSMMRNVFFLTWPTSECGDSYMNFSYDRYHMGSIKWYLAETKN